MAQEHQTRALTKREAREIFGDLDCIELHLDSMSSDNYRGKVADIRLDIEYIIEALADAGYSK